MCSITVDIAVNRQDERKQKFQRRQHNASLLRLYTFIALRVKVSRSTSTHEYHCGPAIEWYEVVAESIEAAVVPKGDLSRRAMGIEIAGLTKGTFVIPSSHW